MFSRLADSVRAAWGWLSAPLASAATSGARRARLLAWLLLTIFAMTAATIFLVPFGTPGSPVARMQYIPFIAALDAVLVAAYLINAAGRYGLAAALTVATVTISPWGAILIDPAILKGDFVPLAYATLSVFLSSILLSPVATMSIALLQFAGYIYVASFNPSSWTLNWPSMLLLLFFASALSILSSAINRDHMTELDRQNQRLAESEAELREISVRDHLTGLFNRRYLEETLDREIQRSERGHYTIGIILFDVDQFKNVNDRWGHAVGDLLLCEIGEMARQHIRGGDIACRYGGDEFLLVMPEASRQATRQRAERVRQSIRQLHVEHAGQGLGPITISAGIAVYPQHGTTREELLAAADQALYRVKESGRDDVEVAQWRNQPLPSTPEEVSGR